MSTYVGTDRGVDKHISITGKTAELLLTNFIHAFNDMTGALPDFAESSDDTVAVPVIKSTSNVLTDEVLKGLISTLFLNYSTHIRMFIPNSIVGQEFKDGVKNFLVVGKWYNIKKYHCNFVKALTYKSLELTVEEDGSYTVELAFDT